MVPFFHLYNLESKIEPKLEDTVAITGILETNDLMYRGESAMCTVGHLAVALALGACGPHSLVVTTKSVSRL